MVLKFAEHHVPPLIPTYIYIGGVSWHRPLLALSVPSCMFEPKSLTKTISINKRNDIDFDNPSFQDMHGLGALGVRQGLHMEHHGGPHSPHTCQYCGKVVGGNPFSISLNVQQSTAEPHRPQCTTKQHRAPLTTTEYHRALQSHRMHRSHTDL